MEKNIWVAPEANEVVFAADSFVSACGDEAGVTYGFVCDAGGGTSGELWNYDKTENFTDGNYHDELGNSLYDSYHACNETHEASSQDEFQKGWFQTGSGSSSKWTEVYIWFEKLQDGWFTTNRHDIHATENLNKSSWTVLKS